MARPRLLTLAAPVVGKKRSTLLSGLVGYWKLGDLTDSVGAHTLTNGNGATFVAGRVGNAASFAGGATNQFLWCASTAELQTGMVDWTFAAHCYFDSADMRVIASKVQVAPIASREWALLGHPESGFQVDAWDPGGGHQEVVATRFGLPVRKAWYFLACGYRTATNKYWIKVNNFAENTATPTVNLAATASKFSIGGYADAGGAGLAGKVDEAGFWKRSLTAKELTELSNNGRGTTYPFTTGTPSGVGPLIFDGDSITYGWGLPDPLTSYPLQLSGLLNRWEWCNYGIAGKRLDPLHVQSMTTEALTRIDPNYNSSRPKNVVCEWGGINDLIAGGTAAVVYNRVVTYCQARRAAGFKVVAMTITPQKADLGNPNFEADRLTVNTNIRNNWATFADAMADPGGHADLQDPDDLTYYLDKIHLTAAGCTVVAGLVQTALATI